MRRELSELKAAVEAAIARLEACEAADEVALSAAKKVDRLANRVSEIHRETRVQLEVLRMRIQDLEEWRAKIDARNRLGR